MLALVSMRFKQPGVVKQNKFGAVSHSTVWASDEKLKFIFPFQLTTNLRTLRQKAASVLKDMSNELSKIGAASSTADQRRVFVTACKPIQEFSEVSICVTSWTKNNYTDLNSFLVWEWHCARCRKESGRRPKTSHRGYCKGYLQDIFNTNAVNIDAFFLWPSPYCRMWSITFIIFLFLFVLVLFIPRYLNSYLHRLSFFPSPFFPPEMLSYPAFGQALTVYRFSIQPLSPPFPVQLHYT